ncbi:homing endonuclease associated repeat-containing protein [Patescibacteria group bacterium]
MQNNISKKVLIEEIQRISKLLGKKKLVRSDFINNSSFTRKDIDTTFGGWANAVVEAGLSPRKHYKITDEELFQAYAEAYKKLKHYPLGQKGYEELSKTTRYSGSAFKKRFGGLKNFLFEFKNWEKEREGKLALSDKLSIKENVKVEISESDKTFENQRRYIGSGAEHIVVGELLKRGFNASIMPVDEGIDVVAVKHNKLYLIQVKHSEYFQEKVSGLISVTTSSFERQSKSNVYYIFVLSRTPLDKTDYLVIPYIRLSELLSQGVVEQKEDGKRFSFKVLHKGKGTAYINNVSDKSDVSYYLNGWHVLLE